MRFIDSGPSRTIAGVARDMNGAESSLLRLAKRFHWDERAAEYEKTRQLISEQKKDAATFTAAVNWAERQNQIREKEFTIAKRMLERAAEMLEKPIPPELDAPAIARIVEVAAKLQRLAAGMSTDNLNARIEEEVVKGDLSHETNKALDAALMRVYGPVVDAQIIEPKQIEHDAGGSANLPEPANN